MLHVSYGLFDDPDAARSAMVAIEAGNTTAERVEVTLHRGRVDPGVLSGLETGAALGGRVGAAFGGVAGAAAGALVMGPAGLAAGGALGAVYGGLAGGLGGASAPDPTLDRLSRQLAEGKVLVVVEAPSLAARDAADAEMRAAGARVEHKRLFGREQDR